MEFVSQGDAHRALAALRESEARFLRMAESTQDVIWITELDPERVVYVSPSFERLWGHTVEALYADPHLWVAGIHQDDRDRVGASFGAWIADVSSTPWAAEFRVVHPGGVIRWILDRGAKSLADGKVRVSGISTDITERRLAEQALASSQERFALAMEAARDGHWDWVIEEDEFYASERMLEIYGFPAGHRFHGQDDFVRQLPFQPGERERWESEFKEYLGGGRTHFEITIGLVRGGQSCHAHLHGLVTRSKDGRPIRWTGSVRDVTEPKRAEAALRQAQRLEAVGTLAGGIAHDFNNILGAILGFAELGTSDTRAGGRARRDIELIGQAAQRGRALVERLLAFSRTGHSEPVAVKVDAVMSDALQLVAPTLPAAILLESALGASEATAFCDPTQLHQVAMNLLTNAVQAMPAGGNLRVATESRRLEASVFATTGDLPAGDYVMLMIEDTGTGIADDVLPRIFDPFFSTKEVGIGAGLGLSLVHGIVSEHGGVVQVESRPGSGSRFTVYLRRGEDHQPVAISQRPSGSSDRSRGLLIVDDDDLMLRLMVDAFARAGFAPTGFASATEALAKFSARPDDFQVVVTDGRMPGMAGNVLIGALRRVRPAIPIVLVTAYIDAARAGESEGHGADAIVHKPAQMRHLVELVSRLARKTQPRAA